jgi:hypothetical protein
VLAVGMNITCTVAYRVPGTGTSTVIPHVIFMLLVSRRLSAHDSLSPPRRRTVGPRRLTCTVTKSFRSRSIVVARNNHSYLLCDRAGAFICATSSKVKSVPARCPGSGSYKRSCDSSVHAAKTSLGKTNSTLAIAFLVETSRTSPPRRIATDCSRSSVCCLAPVFLFSQDLLNIFCPDLKVVELSSSVVYLVLYCSFSHLSGRE